MLAQLDRWLQARGEDVVIRRRTQAGATSSNVDCTVPAIVRALTREQLTSGVSQQNFFIIISPTHIASAQWPGGRTPTGTLPGGLINLADPRIPVLNDQLIFRGRTQNIQRVAPVFDGGQCIRIELSAMG